MGHRPVRGGDGCTSDSGDGRVVRVLCRRFRYDVYAPWLPAVIDAERWAGKDVLEIGVGLGTDHLSFALAGARMHALDLSGEHLPPHAASPAVSWAPDTAALRGCRTQSLPDNSFDLVYSFGACTTAGTAVAVEEVLRVLRPGGVAVIGLYHRDSWFYWLWTILWRGILRLGLLVKGKRRLLSEIEYRSSDNQALPLVKVYSRAAAKGLFTGFDTVSISTHCVDAGHFPPPLSGF